MVLILMTTLRMISSSDGDREPGGRHGCVGPTQNLIRWCGCVVAAKVVNK